MRKNCKGCAYRTISCHSSCQVYLEFQTRNEEKKKNEVKYLLEKKRNNVPFFYCLNSIFSFFVLNLYQKMTRRKAYATDAGK